MGLTRARIRHLLGDRVYRMSSLQIKGSLGHFSSLRLRRRRRAFSHHVTLLLPYTRGWISGAGLLNNQRCGSSLSFRPGGEIKKFPTISHQSFDINKLVVCVAASFQSSVSVWPPSWPLSNGDSPRATPLHTFTPWCKDAVCYLKLPLIVGTCQFEIVIPHLQMYPSHLCVQGRFWT